MTPPNSDLVFERRERSTPLARAAEVWTMASRIVQQLLLVGAGEVIG